MEDTIDSTTRIAFTKLIASVLIISLLSLSCKESKTGHIKIIATTSLIGAIARAIGKDKVDIITIVPAGMCPGHFDIKPGDIASMLDAKILLSHGWEKWITRLASSIENKKLVTKTIGIDGNWMVPTIHKRAANEITKIFCEVDPLNKYWYEKNLGDYTRTIDSTVAQLRELIKKLQDTKVICSDYQTDFLNWLGLEIIATYGRSEELTPKKLANLIEIGKKETVQIVVDNLQSSSKVGEQIAKEIGAAHVILTNFPLSNSYIVSLKENVKKIIRAVEWQKL